MTKHICMHSFLLISYVTKPETGDFFSDFQIYNYNLTTYANEFTKRLELLFFILVRKYTYSIKTLARLLRYILLRKRCSPWRFF
jgi:hypothetical protein